MRGVKAARLSHLHCRQTLSPAHVHGGLHAQTLRWGQADVERRARVSLVFTELLSTAPGTWAWVPWADVRVQASAIKQDPDLVSRRETAVQSVQFLRVYQQ